MKALEELFRKANLHWTGTYLGLCPVVAIGVIERVSALGYALIPDLIEALFHEKDFAIAHVLLTRLVGIEYETMPTWNGLHVEILADGSVHVDPEQRIHLVRRWIRWLASEPRPIRLPLLDEA